MSFTTWSIRSPAPAILLFLLLTIAGTTSFFALRIKNMPDFELPRFQVALSLPGAAPTQLEIQVARPVEDILATLSGVKLIRTTISEGVVLIRVEFDFDMSPADALFATKNAIDRIRSSLPTALEDPSVTQVTQASATPTVTYAVTSTTLGEKYLSWFVEDTVARKISSLPDVYRFDMLGGVAREIQVDVDPVRLAAVGLTVPEVSRALRRMQQNASGGQGMVGHAEQGVRTIAAVQDAEDLASFPIVLTDGSHVRLDEIATAHDGIADRTTAARWDGRVAVGFQVLHKPGADELALCAAVQRAIAELESQHHDIEFHVVKTMAEEVKNEYTNSMHMLLEGALLAVVVIWVFLRNWRSTAISALALPLSMLPTFAAMYFADFTLNTITLLALSVVVGILVDDAIVEVENIASHMRSGVSARAATETAVIDIGRAVIATTLALVVVFLPMSFMTGYSGLLFRQFGWTAAAAVLASLLVARLITPILAVTLMRTGDHSRTAAHETRVYLRIVRWCIRHSGLTLVVTSAFVAGSLLLWPVLPTGFAPPEDGGYSSVNIELPPGVTLDRTLAAADEARRALLGGPTAGVPGVAHVFALVGQPATRRNGVTGGATEVRMANLIVTLTPWGHRASATAVGNSIRESLFRIPGARFSVNGIGFGTKVNVILSSSNPTTLLSAAKAVESAITTIPGLAGVTTTATLGSSYIVIRPDLARAAELGITTQEIADTARIATSGDFAPNLAKLDVDSRQLNIRVRFAPEIRENPETIGQIRIRGRNGLIPLAAIADVSLESSPASIERYNRNRHITISADLGGMSLGDALAAVGKLPVMAALPATVQWVRSDEAELMDELFAGFSRVLIVAAICIYCLLVLLFKDFLQPITILCAAPLSAGGALLGVWVTHSQVCVSVLIGFVMLLGIVTKNSILLVDSAMTAMHARGSSALDAIVGACHARNRPIIMTSAAMIAGMLPLVLGVGAGDLTLSRPMAAAVIGGLTTSTVLTLVVVPVVFVQVARFQLFIHRGPREETQDLREPPTPLPASRRLPLRQREPRG